jgi:hypothetical protein
MVLLLLFTTTGQLIWARGYPCLLSTTAHPFVAFFVFFNGLQFFDELQDAVSEEMSPSRRTHLADGDRL